jgi:hypothetical protein
MVFMESWLAGVPFYAGRDERGQDQWLVQPTGRRGTVPPKIKRILGWMAIEHVMECKPGLRGPYLIDVLEYVYRRAPSVTLRRKGRCAPDAVDTAYSTYLEELANAWKNPR